MNRITRIFIPFLLLMLLTESCKEEEILEVDPVNEFLVDNFYGTDDQVFSALIAAYDPVGWSMAFGNWISPVMFGEIRSDNANAGGDPSDNDQPGWQELDDFRETNTNMVLQPIYRRSYVGIMRANLVLLKPQFASPAVSRYQAEAKFLRAYYHFELFKHFGPIPVVHTLLTPADTDLERDPMSVVFEAITTDLKEAIEELPPTISNNELGRAGRGAAQALLGKAYLYWADLDNDDPAKFDLAAKYLTDVVQSGQYDLLEDFTDLFAPGTKNTRESVFEAQHTNLWPSDWSWMEGIEGNGVVQLCGIRGICNDHPLYAPGWGFLLPSGSLYDHYLADDIYRREATIISVAQLEQDLVDAGITSCNTVVDISQTNPFDYTGYWQKKYANYKFYNGNNVNGGDPVLTKDANTYIIRYADVLLMLAEALHRGTGADGAAMAYINQVRRRAAGPDAPNFRTAEVLMQQANMSLLDVIWYERRAELAGEGDRWYDLVRSGRAQASLFQGDPIRGGNFNPERVWIPISLEETSVAQRLTTYPSPADFR